MYNVAKQYRCDTISHIAMHDKNNMEKIMEFTNYMASGSYDIELYFLE